LSATLAPVISVRKGIAVSLVAGQASFAVAFVSTLFISRLLTPTEIGVYSVAYALLVIMHQVRAFGITPYLVQEKDLTPQRLQSALGVLFITCWGLGSVVILASFPAAHFYQEPGVGEVMRLLSVNFFLAPFGGMGMSLLLRDMRLVANAAVELSGTLTLAVVSVALAWRGHGYMSLAWGSLSGVVVSTLVAAICEPRTVRTRPSLADTGPIVRFGLRSASADLIRSLRANTAELVVGRTLGFDATAFLSRANSVTSQFFWLIGPTIQRVAFPYYAREVREGGSLKPPYLATVAYLTGFAWPFFIVLAILAAPVIRALFGDQWDSAVPVAQILCLAGVLWAPFWTCMNMAIAMGRPGIYLRYELIAFVATVIAVLAGSILGLQAVAWGLCAVALINCAYCVHAQRALAGVSLGDTAQASAKSLVLAMAAGAGALISEAVLPAAAAVPLRLVLGGGLAFVGWWSAIVVTNHPLKGEAARALGYVRRLGRSEGG